MSRLRRLAHRLERRQSKLELRQELVQQRLLRLCPPQLPVSNQLLVARMEQLAELVQSGGLALSAAEMAALDGASAG